jgi:hypothetical protein
MRPAAACRVSHWPPAPAPAQALHPQPAPRAPVPVAAAPLLVHLLRPHGEGVPVLIRQELVHVEQRVEQQPGHWPRALQVLRRGRRQQGGCQSAAGVRMCAARRCVSTASWRQSSSMLGSSAVQKCVLQVPSRTHCERGCTAWLSLLKACSPAACSSPPLRAAACRAAGR